MQYSLYETALRQACHSFAMKNIPVWDREALEDEPLMESCSLMQIADYLEDCCGDDAPKALISELRREAVRQNPQIREFTVEIVETLRRRVTLLAEDAESARKRATDRYLDGYPTLNADDYCSYEINNCEE